MPIISMPTYALEGNPTNGWITTNLGALGGERRGEDAARRHKTVPQEAVHISGWKPQGVMIASMDSERWWKEKESSELKQAGPFPSRGTTNVLRTAPASLPLPGSDRAKQPSEDPEAKGTRCSSFCSGDPNFSSGAQ